MHIHIINKCIKTNGRIPFIAYPLRPFILLLWKLRGFTAKVKRWKAWKSFVDLLTKYQA